MQLDRFKHEFKRLNGVYATDKVVLFRNPLELYSLTTGKIIASFNSLDEALHFEIDGKTLEQLISAWTEITFPVEHGGRGGGSGIGFSGGWPSSGGGSGKDETTADLPARMNVKIGSNRVYEDMVRAFVAAHGDALEEHGVVVDEQGFATKYRHGNAGSISGLTGNGKEIAIHNHPRDGWPTFSKEDVIRHPARHCGRQHQNRTRRRYREIRGRVHLHEGYAFQRFRLCKGGQQCPAQRQGLQRCRF